MIVPVPTWRTHRSVFGDAVLLTFIVVQLCDGFFTYIGVRALGPSAEGNPIVASYMGLLGTGPALLVTKALALGCTAILHVLGRHRIIAALTLVYLVFALWPWSRLFVLIAL